MKTLTPEQLHTVWCADQILEAPQAHIDAEPPADLLDVIENVIEPNLEAILPCEGLGWRLIRLIALKGKLENKILLTQPDLL